MSDKYSEEAFNALFEAINYGDANDRDRNLVSQEQVVQILEALDKEGFCIRKKSSALGDFYQEDLVDERPVDWSKVLESAVPELEKPYDIGNREFKISLTGDGHQQYSVEVKTSHITFVSKSSYLDLLTALKSVIEGVCSEGKDEVETRRLIISNITELFKSNPNFKGVEFSDMLEA